MDNYWFLKECLIQSPKFHLKVSFPQVHCEGDKKGMTSLLHERKMFKLWLLIIFITESLGKQVDHTSQSLGKSTLYILWNDWCWSWNSYTLATDANSWLIGKDPDAWKNWGQKKRGGNRGWEGRMASLIHWTWTWANSGRWGGTEKLCVL